MIACGLPCKRCGQAEFTAELPVIPPERLCPGCYASSISRDLMIYNDKILRYAMKCHIMRVSENTVPKIFDNPR